MRTIEVRPRHLKPLLPERMVFSRERGLLGSEAHLLQQVKKDEWVLCTCGARPDMGLGNKPAVRIYTGAVLFAASLAKR